MYNKKYKETDIRNHASFIETELTTDLDAKATWARCKGYEYQADKPSEENLAKWKNEKKRAGKNHKKKQITACWSASY